MSDSSGNSCEFAEDWDKNAVIYWDQNEHKAQRNDGNRGGRNLETKETSVHGVALFDAEGLQLSQTCVHEDCAYYNWEHSQ